MKRAISLGLLGFIVLATALRPAIAGKKVLYFTHEPGRWHKYTTQLQIFRQIAKKAGWELVREGKYEVWGKDGQTIPIPRHKGDIPVGTTTNILKRAGIKQ